VSLRRLPESMGRQPTFSSVIRYFGQLLSCAGEAMNGSLETSGPDGTNRRIKRAEITTTGTLSRTERSSWHWRTSRVKGLARHCWRLIAALTLGPTSPREETGCYPQWNDSTPYFLETFRKADL